MINDQIELESLLSQYDPGKVLVGPLLSLSMSSNFRYFYIAGNGAKVYESIALGFEAETDAESQRLAIIEKLKSRFEEVTTLGSHLDMAQAVHTLWPNEETTSVLALAALEAKAHPANGAAQDDAILDDSQVCAPRDGLGSELTNAVAGKSAHAKDVASVLTLREAGHPLFHSLAVSAPPSLPDATASWPLSGDHTATQPERPFGFNQDNIAAAVLELKSSMGSVPAPPINATRSAASSRLRLYVGGSIVALLAGIIVISGVRRVANEAALSPAPLISANSADHPVIASDAATGSISSVQSAKRDGKAPQSASTPVRSPPLRSPQTASGAVTPESSSPGPNRKADEPAAQSRLAPIPAPLKPPQSPLVGNAQTGAAISPGPVAKVDEAAPQAPPVTTRPQPAQAPQTANAKADQPAPQAGTVTTAPPPSRPMASANTSQAAGATSGSSSPTSPIAKADPSAPQAAPGAVMTPSPSPKMVDARPETAPAAKSQSQPPIQFNADVIATFVSRAEAFLKSGDFAAARVLLRRAADAGSANATLMLGETFDPAVIDELGAIGIKPDVAQAREWYRKAANLGSDVAVQRLARLARSGQQGNP